jgi:hypothetical protein
MSAEMRSVDWLWWSSLGSNLVRCVRSRASPAPTDTMKCILEESKAVLLVRRGQCIVSTYHSAMALGNKKELGCEIPITECAYPAKTECHHIHVTFRTP